MKGLYIQQCKEHPPKIHDLVKLAKSSQLEVADDNLRFMNQLNRFNIEGRYPEYKNSIKAVANYEFTYEILLKTQELIKCLKSLKQ
ncbi:MAG: HEPN domain-containing protein [Candidatus Kapabacteria bacterium]|nr:HEPN domain-containing protein [Ignavibacteriota bacterium]MCW5884056.1 HEPN domain-containing protein [Candidatus Kapabacteria bacterium]